MKYEEAVEMIDTGRSIPVDEIRALLGGNDGYLRWAGLKACGTQKLEIVADAMIDAISRPSVTLDVEDLTSIAAWSLSQFSKAVLNKLIPEMSTSQSYAVRIAAADLLGLTTHSNETEYLSSLIRDSSKDVAKWAALSLSKKGRIALIPLISALSDANDEVRAGIALEGISRLGTPEALAVRDEYIARPGNEKFRSLFWVNDLGVS